MRGSEGFTLVEVLVALFIFAVGIVGVMALFVGAARTGQMAAEETEAAMVAGTAVADVRSRLDAGQKPSPQPPREAAEFPRCMYEVSVVDLDDSGREFFVRVTVRWKSGGRERKLDFDTIVVRKE